MAEEQRAEEAARKKRVRAAHRGSATRLTAQLEHILDSGDTRQMKQLRQSLTDKLQVLTKLDGELVELVQDDQLEEEVEQADLVRERITLALISLDDGLEILQSRKTTPREIASPSRSLEAIEEDRQSPHVVTHEDHTAPSGEAPAEGVIVPPIASPITATDGVAPPTSRVGPPPLIESSSAHPTTERVVTPLPHGPVVPMGSMTGVLHPPTPTMTTTPILPSTSLTFSGTPPHTSVPSGLHMPVPGFGSFPGGIMSHPL